MITVTDPENQHANYFTINNAVYLKTCKHVWHVTFDSITEYILYNIILSPRISTYVLTIWTLFSPMHIPYSIIFAE